MKTLEDRPRRKPIAGQQTITGDPPAQFCQQFGRLLRDPHSRRRGYGPHCWQQIHHDNHGAKTDDNQNQRDVLPRMPHGH